MKLPICLGAVLVSGCTQGAAETQAWTKPATETVTCAKWAEVPHRGAVFYNNVWNAQAAGDFAWTQCIERDPADPERLGFSWHWPDSGKNVFAQPQAKIGVSPWDPLPTLESGFPVRVADLLSMTVTTEVSVEGPSQYNVVTTLWLTDTGEIGDEPQPDSIIAEIMIWTYATAGHLSPAGSKVGRVRQDGTEWEVWLNEDWHDVSGANDNRWSYVALVAKSGALSARFDPVALLRSKPLAHLDFDKAYIADVELGAEIMRGDGLLWIDRFDVRMEPK